MGGDKMKSDKMEGDKMKSDKMEGDKMKDNKMDGDKMKSDKMKSGALRGHETPLLRMTRATPADRTRRAAEFTSTVRFIPG